MDDRGYDIVIVDASVQFLAPARISTRFLEVYARIYEIGNSSIKMDYEIYEAETERFVAKSQTAYVIVDKDTQKPVRVPPYIRRAVREFESREDIEEI